MEGITIDWLDFCVLVLGSVELLVSIYFFIRFLKKPVKGTAYLLFAGFGIPFMIGIPLAGAAKLLLYIALFAAGGIFICKASSAHSLLYAVITVEIMQFCYGIYNSLASILNPMLFLGKSKMRGLVFMVAGSIMIWVLAAFCYETVYRHFHLEERGKDMLMLLVPMLLLSLVGEYISAEIYGNTAVIEEAGSWGNTKHYYLLVIQLFGFASLFCILYAGRKLEESFQVNMQVSLLEQESHLLHQYVEEAKIRYEKTKSFRHDIKNHIVVVRGLLQKHKLEEAVSYMGAMETMAAELSFLWNTNNQAVDILLENKLGLAKSCGIDVFCSLQLPSPCAIADIDFCVILSNALDNAIAACEKIDSGEKKYIRVAGDRQGDFLLLEIENVFLGEPWKEGTGIGNIRAVAEKYHGIANIKTEGAVFVLDVLLLIPQQPESILQQSHSAAVLKGRIE